MYNNSRKHRNKPFNKNRMRRNKDRDTVYKIKSNNTPAPEINIRYYKIKFDSTIYTGFEITVYSYSKNTDIQVFGSTTDLEYKLKQVCLSDSPNIDMQLLNRALELYSKHTVYIDKSVLNKGDIHVYNAVQQVCP